MPKVFIIILNWNRWPDSLECLDSLKNNDYQNYQIVIVDNGSKKKPELSDANIKFIYNQENLGFSGGNNVGIKYALEKGADYILLLNNDTVVSRNFLSKLVGAGEKDKNFGMIGPKIYFENASKKIWSAGGKVNWLYNKGEMRGFGKIDKGRYDKPDIQETEYLTGCCLLIKREVIEKIGYMPEEYFLYYEDTDWSLKARKRGYKCIFVPKAVIWHKGSKSSISGSSSYIYYHIRNGLVMAKKYTPFYLKPFVHLDALWRAVKQLVKLLFPSKRMWAKAALKGINDFYLGKKGNI